MSNQEPLPKSIYERIWNRILGSPKDPNDPSILQHLSLAAFLAWVGLGVDGLSSAAYGPDEAFRTLGSYTFVAIALAMATAFTVFIISYAYSRLIEHFPHGGGGYVVASQLLGKKAGVVSGCALLVDYVFTITVSIASGGDAAFSLLSPEFQIYKVPAEILAVCCLVIMNLRGLKESVQSIVPFFLLFIATHLILILGGIFMHIGDVPAVYHHSVEGFNAGLASVGKWGLFLVFLRAYSMGGGTYTGIEAVSNGVGALREPRVETGKRTMIYLAFSLAITAGGLLLCYMLFNVHPTEGQTLNAVLVNAFAGSWRPLGIPVGYWFVLATMLSETVLLFIAAQTGFIDGPRVMANMAIDQWLPRRFASLSDRLTMQNGIFLMGAAAITTLLLTRGQIGVLVVMYSINVFVTFSLTEMSMIKFWITERKLHKKWKRNLTIHSIGFILCFSILTVMVLEKFAEGGWATMLITTLCIVGCYFIKNHYQRIGRRIKSIDDRARDIDIPKIRASHMGQVKVHPEFDVSKPTAGILVGGYNKLGRRSLVALLKTFPNTFHNIVFLSVGAINSDFFREGGDATKLKKDTDETLKNYVEIAHRLGLAAVSDSRIGTDIVKEASLLCVETAARYHHVVFIAGELVFDTPRLIDRVLHNETAYAIQRRIRRAGLPMLILPIVLQTIDNT